MRFKRAAVYENILYVLKCVSPTYYNELNVLKAVGRRLWKSMIFVTVYVFLL